jgi:cytoskeletal protein CcmA (bactofilin family)
MLLSREAAARRAAPSLHTNVPNESPSPSVGGHAAPAVAIPAHSHPEEVRPAKLIVGPNIKLKGAEITDCDTLIVEGRVEATLNSRLMQIAETGVFAGTVTIDIAEIRGEFQGELTVRERLIVHATGKIAGRVKYGRIVVEEGARLSGDIARLDDTDGLRERHTVAPLLAVRP